MMEAMWLGLPCVCFYVGGAMQFAEENKEAIFYRFEEPEILAYELDLSLIHILPIYISRITGNSSAVFSIPQPNNTFTFSK